MEKEGIMVRHITWYVTKCKQFRGGSYKIKIENEIEKFKRQNPDTDPVVIFDFMSCITMLIDNEQEILCAGRQTECTRRAREICEKLKKLNVRLIFCLDGPIKDHRIPIWTERVNEKYNNHMKIFDAIKNEKEIDFKFTGQILSTYFDNFLRVAKEYGEIFIALQNDCDRDIAVLACKLKALAVFATDSDFLIMPGDWKIWSPKDLDLNEFTTIEWNKRNLRQALQLRQEQMPILATLCGNDYMPYDMLNHIMEIIPKNGITQEMFAKFVKINFPNNTLPLSANDFDKLVNIIYNNGKNKYDLEKIRLQVRISLDFYTHNNYTNKAIEPNWLREHIITTKSTIVFILLKNVPFTINSSFIDLSKPDVRPYSELVIPLLSRQMGIVLYHERNENEIIRKIYYKSCHEEPFQLHDLAPIYPSMEIPKINDLLGYNTIGDNEVTDEKRFEILAWALSSGRKKLQPSLLMELSRSLFFTPALILNYLVKIQQITVDEADVILLTIYETAKSPYEKMRTIQPPKQLIERPFWIAFVYTHLVYYFINTFIVCGLYKFVKNGCFDGYVFHKMYKKYLPMSYEEKQTHLLLIQKYRLYTK